MQGLELDPRFTFESFVVGANNRLACAAARRVAEAPGTTYNPLFIYSASGLGKTHLLTAIGHHARRINPEIRLVYDTLEQFMEGVMAAIEAGERDVFRDRLSRIELLLLDDVQFLAGRHRTQEEVIRFWDALSSRGGQVVLASDRPPPEIDGIDERLLSRFSGGLIVDIGAPDYETRVAIVRRKAEERGQVLGPGVPEILARTAFANVRELQGALNRLLAVQELEGRTVTAEEVPELVSGVRAAARTEEFEDFLQDIVGVLADAVPEPEEVKDPITEAIERWRAEGYRTRRLELARPAANDPAQVEDVLREFERAVDRLREITGEIMALEPGAPELARADILKDPDRIPEAEELLGGVRERSRPLPAPPPEPTFQTLHLSTDLFAVRAALAVADAPGEKYNPLYIHGPSGAGKSVLLAALGNEIAKRYPELPIAYLDGPGFAAELIQALERNRVEHWRERFRRARVLILDDLHVLAGTERAQEELFHLFDSLQRAGAQLVFAAAGKPRDLEGLQDRLRTRLEAGLVVELPAEKDRDRDLELRKISAPVPTLRDTVAGVSLVDAPAVRKMDAWFRSREKIVWEWPYSNEWLIEELE